MGKDPMVLLSSIQGTDGFEGFLFLAENNVKFLLTLMFQSWFHSLPFLHKDKTWPILENQILPFTIKETREAFFTQPHVLKSERCRK